MGKIKRFLNTTTEITNGERLTICAGILCLTGMALYLNDKLLKARLDNIDKDYDIAVLENALEEHGVVYTRCIRP